MKIHQSKYYIYLYIGNGIVYFCRLKIDIFSVYHCAWIVFCRYVSGRVSCFNDTDDRMHGCACSLWSEENRRQ